MQGTNPYKINTWIIYMWIKGHKTNKPCTNISSYNEENKKVLKEERNEEGDIFKKSNFSAFFYVENSLQMIFDY